ncbi:hypothetical protein BT63DRAFT_246280 [Microthyrium microscopicum]|uniref:RGS domain-containing protein n=1 Tax=Microthyrium microscopicum TaxID=703497 RepID=A0A6A6U9L7_9PEZI|nr:hypothetical protein BT63DRAFT_246280 [Microthyrium microscopicum]
MVLALNYSRPRYVARSHKSHGSMDSSMSIIESESGASFKSMPLTAKGIPDALSFDRIISGGTCPPCTKREFLNYLKYVEFAPENLQFFLWFKDYEKRWETTPNSERVLAPEWTPDMAEAERKQYRTTVKAAHQSKTEKELFKGSDFDEKPKLQETEGSEAIPFAAIPQTPNSEKRETIQSQDGSIRPTTGMRSIMTNHTNAAESAFEDAGLKKPFTVQPHRDEINRILAIYILEHAPRELNFSGRERHATLRALEYTTHPSAFRELVNNVEYSLRQQSHPNFIRWAICNGNRPRVIFARGLGISLILAGIVTQILLTISHAGRAWRVLPILLLVPGIATLIAAWKGMCVVLHGLHHQHVRPWELFAVQEEDGTLKHGSEYNLSSASIDIDSLRSPSKNSFEDEPWVNKYKKRNVVRQVFDRETYIKEPMLRQIQDTIFIQALLAAVLISAIIVAIFAAIPRGHII